MELNFMSTQEPATEPSGEIIIPISTVLKRSGRTDEEVLDEIADAVRAWAEERS